MNGDLKTKDKQRGKIKCEKCGYDDPRALHIHHIRDENHNVIGVATLCANCHYILHRDPNEFRDLEKRELESTRQELKGQLKLVDPVVTRLKELGAGCQVQIDPKANEIYLGETESPKAIEIEGWIVILRDICNRLENSGYSCTVDIRYREGSQWRSIGMGGGERVTEEEFTLYMSFLSTVRENMIKEDGVVYSPNRLPEKWRQRFEEWKRKEIN